jgi:type I restriction enzyme M protein
MGRPRKKPANGNGKIAATLGFEARLRSNMDAAEYKHVVLGLIFLKYISDALPGEATCSGAAA